MKKFIWLIAYFITISTLLAQSDDGLENNPQTLEKSYLELPRVHVVPIKDTKTGRQYELYIKLPETYIESRDKIFPVIYFTDAMWHIEMLSGSAEYIIEEAILVGVSWEKGLNGELDVLGEHASRFRDYSTRKSNNPAHQAKYQFGQASNHLDFIRNDVINYIENNYRTNPDKSTYFGYSLGGKFGAYILLTQPRTFKNYILGSPSLKGEIPYFSSLESNETFNKGLNANVFISYGSLEVELGQYVKEFINLLKSRNDENLSLAHEIIEGSHKTAFPMTTVRSVLWLSNLIK